MKTGNFAILGATGHIAKSLIFQFCKQRKYRLFLFVRSLERMQNFLKIIGHDKNNDDIILKSFEEFERGKYNTVINCVGRSDPSKLRVIGSSIFRLTEKFDNLILDYLERVPDTLYINFSSGAVYGTNFNVPVSENDLATINVNHIDSSSFYRITKINAEAKHRALKSFNIIDLRIFNFFSRFIDVNAKFLINEVISCIKQGKEFVTIPGNITRDYVHPKDLLSIIEKSIDKQKINEAFDVYSLKPVTKFEILDYFTAQYGLKYIVKSDKRISTATGSKEHYYSNSKKAQKIGYIPQFTSMDSIIQESKALLK